MARLLISAVLALWGIFALTTNHAYAVEKRVALVVGNSDYKDQSLSLGNPKNDANAVADVLRSLDFEVQLVTNVGKRDMDGVMERFARLSVSADTALFFYAGHAIQYQGKNYLMPVDAQLEDEISIRYNLVAVDDVRMTLDRASGVKIMVLDACRNNPIADRLNRMANGGQTRGVSATRGLARIDKTQGMVVAYATAPDDVALDGTNADHSPFSTAFIKEMQEPGLEIGTLFRRVARDVNDATGGRQRPETSISLLSDYYLNQSDRKIWESMRETADIPQIREFLRRYPNSISGLDAKYRLDVLERAKRDREDEEVRIRREALRKELEEQEAATRAEIARLKREREQADTQAAAKEEQRKRDEQAQLAALEEQRKKDQQAQAERVAQQQREEQQRLAKLEEERKNAEKALAEKKEAEQRRQAAEKLAALEQERVKAQQEVAAREEARRKDEEARRKAEETCKAEQSNVDAAGRDESKLKAFIGSSSCADAKVRAQSVVAALVAEREQAQRACDSEGKQVAALAKAPGTTEARDKLLDLQSSLTCSSLSPKIVETLARVNIDIKKAVIRSSQAELRRVGCYRGAENGDLNDATKDGLKKVYAALGKPTDVLDIDDAVLSDLKKTDAPVCTPPKVEPEDKPVASRPSRTKAASRPSRAVHDDRPAPSARAESRPSSGGGGGGGGGTSVHGISF
ncbi:caspase family protein [Bradyrhizobium diazoefficiens]|nr:caspase family protein [Bradyrhizobium diazoefficiens]MBR0779355.1 caspase family protein [Bradyrhizobium diazoefficiens]